MTIHDYYAGWTPEERAASDARRLAEENERQARIEVEIKAPERAAWDERQRLDRIEDEALGRKHWTQAQRDAARSRRNAIETTGLFRGQSYEDVHGA